MKYIIGIVLGIALGIAGAPLWREVVMSLFQERYGDLTYLCDSAMREHYIARARLAEAPGEELVETLQAAEIALIDCQDYDMLQKRLTLLGLRENELGLMRLRAIEGRNGRLDEVVRVHEIRD